VDLRLISASHMDVEAMTHEGARFRADLWARMSGVRVELVPLRDRREDLGLLIGSLLRRLAEERADAIRFQVKAVRALLAHDWPLNVRELEKTLGAALALATDGTIGLTHLPPAFGEAPEAPAAPAAAASPAAAEAEDTLPFSEADLETRAQLIRLLEEHRGSIAAVARAMGKARIQIQRWVKRFEIDVASYKR
jgi:DNA-binding NtrC family response regulator